MVQQPAERRQSPESTSEPAQHQSEQSRQNKPLQLSPAMATAILKQVLPHVPSMFYKSATHVLSLSPTAQHWDLRSTLVLEVVRAFVRTPPPGEHTVEKAQRASIKPQKVDNETVKIDVKYGVEDDEEKRLLEEAVRNAICSLGEQGLVVDPVGVEPLTAEWVGRRLKKGDGSMHLGEKERFEVIEKGVKDDRTILYFHGGAYYMLDPHSHRSLVSEMSAASSARVFLVRYRLAPQNPFPAAIIDALITYLTLLYPPPGSLHKPIPAEKIVFSGDSAGGNLSLSLLQLLYTFTRSPQTIKFHGRELTDIPLPGGVATLSAWVDVPRAFGSLGGRPEGSEDTCMEFDYLPAPQETARTVFHDSPAWNAEIRKRTGRTTFYAADRFCDHPLVSPVLAPHWSAADGKKVPIYLAIGDECLRDANLWFSWRLEQLGVPQHLQWFEKMPHVFQAILTHLPATKESFKAIGQFVEKVTTEGGANALECEREKIHPRSLKRKSVTAEECKQGLELEEVTKMIQTCIVEYRKIAEEVNRTEEAGRKAKI